MNIYYTIDIELNWIDGVGDTTGNKTVTVYDIDTQTFTPFVLFELELILSDNTEKEIKEYIFDNEEFRYLENDLNLVQL